MGLNKAIINSIFVVIVILAITEIDSATKLTIFLIECIVDIKLIQLLHLQVAFQEIEIYFQNLESYSSKSTLINKEPTTATSNLAK